MTNDRAFDIAQKTGATREQVGKIITLLALAPDYGHGRQPLDDIININDIINMGWAPIFSAANVLKYLRGNKHREHSLESARFYYKLLTQLVDEEDSGSDAWRAIWIVKTDLDNLLNGVERDLLK